MLLEVYVDVGRYLRPLHRDLRAFSSGKNGKLFLLARTSICNPLNYQSDKRYKNPTLHIIAYVINWATVVINPIVYVVSQKKYKVGKNITSIILFALCTGRYYIPERQSTDLFQERDRTEI